MLWLFSAFQFYVVLPLVLEFDPKSSLIVFLLATEQDILNNALSSSDNSISKCQFIFIKSLFMIISQPYKTVYLYSTSQNIQRLK